MKFETQDSELQETETYTKKDMIRFACKVFNKNYCSDKSFRKTAKKYINKYKKK